MMSGMLIGVKFKYGKTMPDIMTMDKMIFDNYRRYIYKEAGINIGEKKESLLIARVGKRMRALNIENYAQYLKYVKFDKTGEEKLELLDAISTNVTHFFREYEHFKFMEKEIKRRVQAGQRRFRIWCAASSSGEEPYSLAITLKDATGGLKCDHKILGTDISTKVLRKCKEAVYTKENLQSVPAKYRTIYFDIVKENRESLYHVKSELKKIMRFARLNLAKPPFPMKGPFDMIWIRNVMIYFDDKTRIGLLNEACRLLDVGGYLVVGHAESMAGLLTKNLVKTGNSIYIKK